MTIESTAALARWRADFSVDRAPPDHGGASIQAFSGEVER